MFLHPYSTKRVFLSLALISTLWLNATKIINDQDLAYQRNVLEQFAGYYPLKEQGATDQKLYNFPFRNQCLHLYVPLLRPSSNNHISLDLVYIKKMDLFGESSIFEVVNNTKTTIGALQLALQLTRPLVDIPQLIERQTTIKALLEHSERSTIETALASVAQQEPAILQFFETPSEASQKHIAQYYFGKRLAQFNTSPKVLQAYVAGNYLELARQFTLIPFWMFFNRYAQNGIVKFIAPLGIFNLKKILNALNTQKENFEILPSRVYEYKQLEEQISQVENNISMLQEASKNASLSIGHNARLTAQDIKLLTNSFCNPLRSNDYINNGAPITLGDKIHSVYSKNNPINPYLKPLCAAGLVSIGAGVIGYQIYNSYKAVQSAITQTEVFNHLHQHMIKVADYIRTIDQLSTIINNDPSLRSLSEFHSITHFRESLSPEAQRLVSILETQTFNRSTPTIISLSGNVLAAYKLMHELKDEFIPSLQAVGILDAYMSTAKLLNHTALHNGEYHFAHYIDGQSKPYLRLTNFWNPLIDFKHAVTNCIEFGGVNPHNAILTGPNTAGKTTTLRSIILNAHLAQTLGVCAAQQVILTPFSTFNCYINVTDDLSSGVSLFKAEVLRAKALLNSVESLSNNSFALSLIDEMFSGTSPQEGEQAAYSFASKLGVFDHSITIVATHYAKLTDLEHHSTFKNYHMSAWKDQQGWHRPFVIQPGISTLNIAAELLAEEGVL